MKGKMKHDSWHRTSPVALVDIGDYNRGGDRRSTGRVRISVYGSGWLGYGIVTGICLQWLLRHQPR